jgi:Bifunctional DNA primase/polymerase, N-terminal
MSVPLPADVLYPELLKNASAFRRGALANGYKPVPVRTGSKQPLGKNWQHGGDAERLLNIGKDELNTGILAAGLRCIDADIDDPQIAAPVKKQICKRFPGALIRQRANSSRFAVVVRAAEGEPGKRKIVGSLGQIEVLGARQQFVADGVHESGAVIEWEDGRGPDRVQRDQLPAVQRTRSPLF